MNVAVVTPEDHVQEEIETCNLILKYDQVRLHVRKPTWNQARLREYLRQLDSNFLNTLSLHQHLELVDELGLGGKHWKSNLEVDANDSIRSKSYHSYEDIAAEPKELNYAFLSPVFDSISKQGYQGKFDLEALKVQLLAHDRCPIFALGGIDLAGAVKCKALGFDGVAVLGSFWKLPNQTERIALLESLLDV